MGIKKTLVGLVLAAASLLPLGCNEKTKIEYRDVDHWQTPVAQVFLFSDDGTNTAMMVQEKDDYEVYLFNSANNSCANISKDPVNTDFPITFAGNNAVTISSNSDDTGELKVYDESGNLAFRSGLFDYIHDHEITVCNQGSKIIFEGDLGQGNGSRVYVHQIGSQSLDELIQNANYAYIEGVSQDKSLVYLEYSMPVTGQILAMYNTTNDTLTPVLNLGGHNVTRISKNNKKALLEYWTGSSDGLKVQDIDTNSVQIVNLPAGKSYRWEDQLSEDGTGAVFMMQDNTTNDWEWYHLDTDTLAVSLIKSLPSTQNWFYSAEISSNGNIVAIIAEDLNEKIITSLYNQATLEFYDPLSTTPKDESHISGFTLDDKVVLSYREPMAWSQNFVLHDPATKANTPIAESGYNLSSSATFTPDRKYFVIGAEEDATGWEVVILKDFVNNTTKIVKPTIASDCNYIDATSDSSRIYMRTEYKDLVAYDVANDSFVQITNNTLFDKSVNFRILGHSKDNKKVFFREDNWNDTETVKQYDFDTGETKIVAYSN